MIKMFLAIITTQYIKFLSLYKNMLTWTVDLMFILKKTFQLWLVLEVEFDAAYCLILACQILKLNYSINDYMEIVSELGSDIPLFFYESSIYMEGTGNIIKPIVNKIDPYILIVKEKDKGLSTKYVYN